MINRTKLTATERAEAELSEALHGTLVQAVCDGGLSKEAADELQDGMEKIAELAQAVIMARLKTEAYKIRESYNNSGAESTLDADVWDDAVQAADPAQYEPQWTREWTS